MRLALVPALAALALPPAAPAPTTSRVYLSDYQLPAEGYHYYGPQSGSLTGEAVFITGVELCEPSLPPALESIVVFSDGVGCATYATSVYEKLNAAGVAAFVWVLPFRCPRGSTTFLREYADFPTGVPHGAMAVSVCCGPLSLC